MTTRLVLSLSDTYNHPGEGSTAQIGRINESIVFAPTALLGNVGAQLRVNTGSIQVDIDDEGDSDTD